MAEDTLVDHDREIGARFVKALDDAGIPVQTALWLYDGETERWKLVIATPIYDDLGPREAYQALQTVLMEHVPEAGLLLNELVAMSPRNKVVRALHSTVQTRSNDIDGIRLTGNYVDQTMIDDAYIYRVA